MDWMLIDNIQDDEKIYKGACFRFYNTEKSLAEQCALSCGKDDHDEIENTEFSRLVKFAKNTISRLRTASAITGKAVTKAYFCVQNRK